MFPEPLCTAILMLPIAPPVLGDTDGTRASYNRLRTFITPALQKNFPPAPRWRDALQRPDVARAMAETCDIDVSRAASCAWNTCRTSTAAWLEPHRDIPEKLFSMVIYLFTGPGCEGLGHRHLRCRPALGGPFSRHFQFRRDLRARPRHLARFRAPPDRGRPPPHGDQLRPPRLARPRPALLPRTPDKITCYENSPDARCRHSREGGNPSSSGPRFRGDDDWRHRFHPPGSSREASRVRMFVSARRLQRPPPPYFAIVSTVIALPVSRTPRRRAASTAACRSRT